MAVRKRVAKPKSRAPTSAPVPKFPRIKRDELFRLTDDELKLLRDETRYKMRIGHPPYEPAFWNYLCELEAWIRLETVDRHFTGTKVRRLKYGK